MASDVHSCTSELDRDSQVRRSAIVDVISINLVVLSSGQSDPVRDVLTDVIDLRRIKVLSPAAVPEAVCDLNRSEGEAAAQSVS